MTAKKSEQKTEPVGQPKPTDEVVDEREPQGIEALGNPWDRAYPPGEQPPNPLDPKNRTSVPPSEVSHIGEMSDPTPRDRYTVAGQIQAANEAQSEGTD